MKTNSLICIKNCRIENSRRTIIEKIDWEMHSGEKWLVIGPNGGGKADFFNALSGETGLKFTPNSDSAESVSLFSNAFTGSTEIVSLEKAARIIQEERENDESDYLESGVDIGRTGRVFISERLQPADTPATIDTLPEVELTGIQKILDRGLKYMSTGEIRRTLLARALLSGKKLLLLSDPFAGLDAESRKILFDFVNNAGTEPAIILGMERWHEIPDNISHVLEFTAKSISFCGTRAEYKKLMQERLGDQQKKLGEQKSSFTKLYTTTKEETDVTGKTTAAKDDIPLVQMTNVNVSWSDNHVLRNLSWTVNKGEHWLIRGPNGSGKTTLLELITGDNMQVFCNDVRLFGIKRGSGESIWDIKKHLGIVSYRLHVEYRMLGGTSLENVIISGFRDSIGLYEAATDTELALAKKWLDMGGFAGREKDTFGSLSYGEQRAILILRSAVKCPSLLILDEPCHGLDESYRAKILHLMELIGEGGTTTMLHVTHDMTEKLPCEKKTLELMPECDPMYRIIAS
ncbi:MAG: ATP-binding cassette domain-containing protein [Treponema sp.]|nr:ATP-binding cassette domain-containing protein [Treponema sp.]